MTKLSQLDKFSMPEFAIKRLFSGGLITNYSCSSNCQHCLYACSPRRRPDYINEDDALKYFGLIGSMGCNAVHIGGGEPFLQPEKLSLVLKAASQAGVKIEYVETNSLWKLYSRPLRRSFYKIF